MYSAFFHRKSAKVEKSDEIEKAAKAFKADYDEVVKLNGTGHDDQ